MRGFFDRLDSARFSTLRQFVQDASSPIETANVEEVIGLLDQIEDAPLTDLGPLNRWRNQTLAVRQDLGRYCIDRLCCARWTANHWATCLLASADSNTTVITTNYDNLAESILSAKLDATHEHQFATCHHCRMRRILLHDCHCTPTPFDAQPEWRGSVVKLHGSVAWKTCLNRTCRSFDCLIADEHCRPFDSQPCECCGEACQPVIVLPSHLKHYGRYSHLKRMWDAAASAMNDAERLVIFGFSFPTSDCLIKMMLRTAVNHRRLKSIAIVDARPGPVAERVRQVIPRDFELEIELFEVPTDGSEPEWWKREVEAVAAQQR